MLNVHDIHISYLPLAHMFERVIQVCVGQVGKKRESETLKIIKLCLMLCFKMISSIVGVFGCGVKKSRVINSIFAELLTFLIL